MQDKVPPSRTPRPAHPALLAADRLVDMRQRYNNHLSVEELECFSTVRKALWRISEQDES